MDKNRFKLLVDFLMFVDFSAVAVSGFVLKSVRGSGSWRDIHESGAVILIVLLLVHLILNMQWIKSMIRSLFEKRANGKISKSRN